MLPEYLKYWGLDRPPFSLTPDPEMLYMSRQHQEGLIRLKYAVVSNKGGALLISENAGDGKTSLLAKLRTELAEYYQGNCRIVFIDHPTLTANQMVGEIARQLGVGCTTTDKLTILNELRAFLLACHEQGEKCVVMLDEGQMLCHRPDLLQELRILLNFCVSDAFLLTFILSGQKPLDEAIRAMPEFYQRLPVRFFLRNLDMDDSRELIRHRLHVAGCQQGREIFGEDGYAGIYNHSKGCPRVICSVADLSLVIAHSRFADKVDFVSVSQATSDMNRTDGAYHYFHFLNSFKKTEIAGGQEPEMPLPADLSCPACTGEILPESSFCTHCGYALKAARDAEAAAQEAEIEPQMAAAPPAMDRHREKVPPLEPESNATQVPETPVAGTKNTHEPVSPAMFSFDEGEDKDPGANLQRAIRFILDGEEDTEENAGAVQSVPEKKQIDKTPEAPAVEITRSEESGKNIRIEQEVEAPAGPEPEPPSVVPEPDTVKCGFCGLDLTPQTAECPNCGEALRQIPPADEEDDRQEHEQGESSQVEQVPPAPAPEDELLNGLRELKLEKYMPAGAESPANGNSELLRLPRARFLGRSTVMQFVSRDDGDFFTSRCGVRVGRDQLMLETSGGTDTLAYELIEQVGTDTVSNGGTVLLGQLVITAREGTYRLTLPFKADTGGRLATLLHNYIGGRMPATVSVTHDQSNQPGAEDSNGNGHD